jgi:hypothetical protein
VSSDFFKKVSVQRVKYELQANFIRHISLHFAVAYIERKSGLIDHVSVHPERSLRSNLVVRAEEGGIVADGAHCEKEGLNIK